MVKSKKAGAFDYSITIILIIIGIVCVFPLMYVLSVSLTPMSEVYKNGGFIVIPKKVTFAAYNSILFKSALPRSLVITVAVTLVGTVLSLVLTSLCAYPLSRRELPGRKFLVPIFIFTMLFTGGIIPTYLVVKMLGLTGTYWSMVLPAAISTYNLLVMKSFFEGLPNELVEAARIDGAGEFNILGRIVMPLSRPVVMTVGLFYLVTYWNTYFAAIMYISDEKMYPLQVILKRLLTANASLQNVEQILPTTTLQMAAVIVTCIPMIVIYPFLQKYFTKGMTLGAVKG